MAYATVIFPTHVWPYVSRKYDCESNRNMTSGGSEMSPKYDFEMQNHCNCNVR